MEEEENPKPFQEPVPLDLKIDTSSFADLNYEEETKNIGYATGYRLWQHYKKSSLYTVSQVIDIITQLQAGMDTDLDSEANQNIINRLHWNIYFGSPYTQMN